MFKNVCVIQHRNVITVWKESNYTEVRNVFTYLCATFFKPIQYVCPFINDSTALSSLELFGSARIAPMSLHLSLALSHEVFCVTAL